MFLQFATVIVLKGEIAEDLIDTLMQAVENLASDSVIVMCCFKVTSYAFCLLC